MRYASIDFETANQSRNSACAVGLAEFDRNGLIHSEHWRIKPPKGFGWFREDFTAIHKMTHLDVRDSPEFPAIAPAILERLASVDFVIAHKASFDRSVLAATCEHVGITLPPIRWLCTCEMARLIWPGQPHYDLKTLCDNIRHDFHHHDAQQDAVAAGHLLLTMLDHPNSTKLPTILRAASTSPGGATLCCTNHNA